MELKYVEIRPWRDGYPVLIAPLWNWNEFDSIGMDTLKSSNRTFMELK